MIINGRFYHDPVIQVNEIALAVSRLSATDPLRSKFEFLIGYIDAQDEAAETDEDLSDQLHTANETIGIISSLIDRALEECGEEAKGDDLEERVKTLTALLAGMKNGISSAHRELDRIRV